MLFIGRPVLEKGLGDLLTALDQLPHLPWHLSVVGESPPLEVLATNDPRITRRGALPHRAIPEVMREHDILVVPSRYETFGNVVLEGLASGMIVVASRTGGLKTLIDDGRTGIHFTPGDSADLAKALTYVITHASSLTSMRRAARAEAMKYSWAAVAATTATLLARIL